MSRKQTVSAEPKQKRLRFLKALFAVGTLALTSSAYGGPIGIFTPLGYPADSLGPKVRKPLTELVRYEHW